VVAPLIPYFKGNPDCNKDDDKDDDYLIFQHGFLFGKYRPLEKDYQSKITLRIILSLWV